MFSSLFLIYLSVELPMVWTPKATLPKNKNANIKISKIDQVFGYGYKVTLGDKNSSVDLAVEISVKFVSDAVPAEVVLV